MQHPQTKARLGAALLFVTTAAAPLFGCTGAIEGTPGTSLGPGGDPPGEGGKAGKGGSTSPPAGTPDPAVPDPGPTKAATPGAPVEARVWRLTRVQYDNTVRDLLGDTSSPAKDFLAESGGTGFLNAETTLTVSNAFLDQASKAAQRIAAATVADANRLKAVFPCGETKLADDTCAKDFVTKLGRRAFRRPLTADEITGYFALYTNAKAKLDAPTAVSLVIEAMLESPHFLFRTEVGDGKSDAAGRVKLTAHEVAAQLSYYLWNTMPDADLAKAADGGTLLDKAELERQARRLLDSDRAKPVFTDMFQQMMGYGDIGQHTKTGGAETLWSDARGAMADETARFIEEVVWKGDGSLATLLTAPFTFVNKPLAALYGLPGVTGDAFQKVTFDAASSKDRAGLLTHPGLMALTAHNAQTSPVLRGKFVSERVLCLHIPDPPPNVMAVEPPVDKAKTTRDRFKMHADQSCASCHKLLDEPGYAFEHLDWVGRVRRQENGVDVDTSGTINGTSDANGAFANVAELSQRLAGSRDVRACLAKQVFRFATGRVEQDGIDDPSLDEMFTAFEKGGFTMKALFLAHILSDRFLVRRGS